MSHSDLTLCAGNLKWKSPSEGQKQVQVMRGEDTAIKSKLIIICEIMFGIVTLVGVMLNLTVICSERKGISFR